jgi:hypothetical protein
VACLGASGMSQLLKKDPEERTLPLRPRQEVYRGRLTTLDYTREQRVARCLVTAILTPKNRCVNSFPMTQEGGDGALLFGACPCYAGRRWFSQDSQRDVTSGMSVTRSGAHLSGDRRCGDTARVLRMLAEWLSLSRAGDPKTQPSTCVSSHRSGPNVESV